MSKYYLCVLSMFKNESTIIEQWIKHYMNEGVEHFYLIDNGSTDNYNKIIDKYIDYITLVKDSYRHKFRPQVFLYNKHYLDIIKKETKWIIVCDIDEYIYNIYPLGNITKFLKNIEISNENISLIWIPWLIFGSKNYKETPINIINSLNKRINNNDIKQGVGYGKSIYLTEFIGNEDTNYEFDCVHFSKTFGKIKKLTINSNLKCNHYQFISYNYYKDIKCFRQSGSTNNHSNVYTINYFNEKNKIYNNTLDNTLKNKQKIPKIIIQTYHTFDEQTSISKNKLMENNNNNYEYKFFNNDDCLNFIKDNFDKQVLNAYNSLLPPAFKADLFRYCYLYVNGGIYCDIDLKCENSLDDLINDNLVDLIIPFDRKDKPGLYQAFMMAKPGLYIFKLAIDEIIKNVKNKYDGEKIFNICDNTLTITGPFLLANCLCKIFNIKPFTIRNLSVKNDIIKNDDIKIKLGYFKQGRIYFNDIIYFINVENTNRENHYIKLFKNNEIYL